MRVVSTEPPVLGDPTSFNREAWLRHAPVRAYASRTLRPVETVVLSRYAEKVRGRTLEIGCGAGRLLGYLAQLSAEAHGIDISAEMVAHCAAHYPTARVRVADLADPHVLGAERFDLIWAGFNVIDVLDDRRRRETLRSWADALAPGGSLVFSSHNLPRMSAFPAPARMRKAFRRIAETPPASIYRHLRAAAGRRRGQRAAAGFERREGDYWLLADASDGFGLLHYHIGRDAQARQLEEVGLRLVECLDHDGYPVLAGQHSPSTELHYVVRSV